MPPDFDAPLDRESPLNEGMTHGEIGEATSIPLGTVKSHITRGSARLRELLHAYGDAHV